MKQHPTKQELSAYLDGESDDPCRMAQHLRACGDCAELYRELGVLSSRMKDLPVPEVCPLFCARVLAEVKAAAPAPHRGWWSVPLWRMVAAASVVLLFGLVLNVLSSKGFGPGLHLYPPFPDEQTLQAELEQRLAQWPESAMVEEDGSVPDAELLAGMMDDEWIVALLSDLDPEAGYDSSLDGLTREESEDVRQLLMEYEKENIEL